MYKRVIFILAFLFTFSSLNASANFACGEINPGNYSSAWMTVYLNYKENPLLKVNCDVSPSNNKYCCDPRSISGVSWAIGKVVEARIVDSSGYFTDTTNLTISGAGYDLFPIRNLKRGVKILSPSSSYLLNNGTFYLSFMSSAPFMLSNYSLVGDGNLTVGNLCNCTNQSLGLLNLSSGNYELRVFAYDGQYTLTDSVNFTLLDFLKIDRYFECEKCTDSYVPSNSDVSVKIIVNSSHEIKGDIYDYFPKDWIYTQKDNIEYGSEYNKISWVFNGKFIEKKYNLRTPKVTTRKYLFSSAINDFFDFRDRVSVYSFTPLMRFLSFGNNQFSIYNKRQYVKNPKNDPQKPLVLYSNDSYISEVALFPNYAKEKSELYLDVLDKKKDELYNFNIGSNVDDDDVDYIFLKLKLDKKKNAKSIANKSIFLYKTDNLEQQKIIGNYEDNDYYYYEIALDGLGQYNIKVNK